MAESVRLSSVVSINPLLKDDISVAVEEFGLRLANFEFDIAKESLESFRASHLASGVIQDPMESAWAGLILCLVQLSQAEKAYFALSFLLPKGFLRKEHVLKANYNAIRTEMLRISDSVQNARLRDGGEEKETLVEHLLTQFRAYLSARIDLMNFYEKLSAVALPKGMSLVQCIELLKHIQAKHTGNFTHPLVSKLEESFNYETETLLVLLECQNNLVHVKFLPSLLALVDAQSRLTKWLGSVELREQETKSTWWLTFSSTQKQAHALSLCIWMQQLYDKLMSKFSLYFIEMLSIQAPSHEFKHILAKTAVNHASRLSRFQQKYDALHCCIILNAQQEVGFQSIGYSLPSADDETRTKDGVGSFPFIFCSPIEKPTSLHPSIIMILEKYQEKLMQNSDYILREYDSQKSLTYLVTRIEGNLYLVVIFHSGSKPEKDASVLNFMQETCTLLTCDTMFASLKAPPK